MSKYGSVWQARVCACLSDSTQATAAGDHTQLHQQLQQLQLALVACRCTSTRQERVVVGGVSRVRVCLSWRERGKNGWGRIHRLGGTAAERETAAEGEGHARRQAGRRWERGKSQAAAAVAVCSSVATS
jgi:hypothetical protein